MDRIVEIAEREKTGPGYSADYLEWKSWGDEGFATLAPSTERYYTSEVKRAGLLGKPSLDVLEIGFGNGDFLTFAKRQGWNVTGTEMIPELVATAREAGFDAYDASGLRTFATGSFDLVMAMDVLEHIPVDDIVPFMAAILRVLRPGGLLLAHFPNGDSPFGLLYQNGDATHVNAIGTGKARPIIAGNLAHSVQRLVAWPFKAVVNLLVRYVFLPATRIDFCAPALTMILRKRA